MGLSCSLSSGLANIRIGGVTSGGGVHVVVGGLVAVLRAVRRCGGGIGTGTCIVKGMGIRSGRSCCVLGFIGSAARETRTCLIFLNVCRFCAC